MVDPVFPFTFSKVVAFSVKWIPFDNTLIVSTRLLPLGSCRSTYGPLMRKIAIMTKTCSLLVGHIQRVSPTFPLKQGIQGMGSIISFA